MPNPLDPAYLTEASATFGFFAWIVFIIQFVLIAGGVYLTFAWNDSNKVRKELLSKLGQWLMIIGGIGIVVGGLRLADIPVLNQRFWFYIILIIEVLLGGYAYYYAQNIYPDQLRTSQTNRGKESSKQESSKRVPAPQPSTSTLSENAPSQQSISEVSSSSERSRRDARRDRKRRKK